MIITIALVFILLSAPVFGETGIWPEKRHDAGNTNSVDGVGDIKNGNLVEKWRFGPVDEMFGWNFVADINGDGKNEVVTSTNHTIVAINGESGKPVWNYTDPSFYYENESIYPSVLSLVKMGNKWDILTGYGYPTMRLSYKEKNPVWTFYLYNASNEYYGFHWVGILYSRGNAYGVLERPDIYSGYPTYPPASREVGNSSVILFNISDSKLVWQKNFPLFAISTGIGDINGDSSDDIVLTGLGRGGKYSVLMALDVNGNEEWNVTGNFSGDRFFIGNITGDKSPEILLGNYSGYSCFDNHGTPLWNITFEWEGENSIIQYNTDFAALYEGKGIVMEDFSGYLYFVGGNGKILWKRTLSGYKSEYPVIADIDGDGVKDILLEVFNGSAAYKAMIVCLDSTDGSEKWSYILSGNAPPSTLIVADVDSDGKLEILVAESVENESYLICLEPAQINGGEGGSILVYLITLSSIIAVAVILYMKKHEG